MKLRNRVRIWCKTYRFELLGAGIFIIFAVLGFGLGITSGVLYSSIAYLGGN